MAVTTTLRTGMSIMYKDQAWLIAGAQFVSPGKGSAFTKTKLKNLKTGQTVEITFKSTEALELVDVQHLKCQYLYNDGESYHFMNNDTYDQFSLDKSIVGDAAKFLMDGAECYAMYVDNNPVSIQLQPKMAFKVISAPPRSRGDTATTETKECTIETGATVRVPGFISEGDVIRVNTEDGSYVGKA